MLGTIWTTPGNGSTVSELRVAFGDYHLLLEAGLIGERGDQRTNLRLKGFSLTPYDRARLLSASFKIGE